MDTSVVFPHKMGPPFKRALKFLAADHLKRIIQNDGEEEGGLPKLLEMNTREHKKIFLLQ